MADRFELEQQIMACWNITDDLNMLNEHVLERDLTTDQISNILLGLEEIYKLRFDKMFKTFEACVRTKQFGS